MTHRWIDNLKKITDKEYVFLEGSFDLEFIKLDNNYLLICVHADREIRERRLLNRKQSELANEAI